MRLKVDPTSLAAYLTQTDEGRQFTWNVACRLWPGHRLSGGAMPGTKAKNNPGPEQKSKSNPIWGWLTVLLILAIVAWLAGWPLYNLVGLPLYDLVKGAIGL